MTLDQLMQYPVEIRRAWTQHEAGLNLMGDQVCMRCGIGLPRLLPVFRPVATYRDRLYLGEVPDARPCQSTP